ncbi:hypothetical protein CYME_CMI007C [Cyanidioschyzon merolae strain 10D]|uniref:Uncharacterized protein n=1 Tax=Cyanidioschyzon merolae (strain NIES-3377 / 10D) TaxID=280699 RepID=M1V7N1_CYAM1|nr:hypothetical protein CYME_CMI007C [Cyanidioschyzon merolae strain 10D]BAM79924.1 hypothetical protein CYME_CMI007C [Cyanidioschyzon merolae strain 10D]|eukprot:XP_005536210.1 hypothetical protein CYME_CMI007C [Cyanidioschyzon merolae strain 10D]
MKFTRTLSVILCITIAQAILLTVSTEASSPIKTDGESRSLTSSGLRWQFCEPETVVGPCSLVKTCAAYENILVCAKENIVCTTAAPETKSPEYGGPWNGKVTWRRRWTSDTTFEDAAPQKNIQKCRKECVFKSVEVCVEYKYQNTCKVCVQKFEALQICPKSSTAVYEKGNVQRQNELDWKTSRKWTSSYGEESTTSTSIVLGEFCTYECKLLSETCSVEVFPIQTPRPIQQTPFPEATKSHMAQTPPQTVHRTLPPTPVVTSHEPTVVQTITVPPSRTAVVSTSATALITVVSTLIPVRSPVLSATTVSNISTTSKPTSIATSTTRPTQKPTSTSSPTTTSTSSPTTTSTSSPTTTSTSSPTTTASCPDGLVYTCLLGDICGCVTTSGSCPGNLVKLCVGDTCVCVEAGTPTPSPSFSQPTSTSTSTSTASSTSVPTCPGGVVYTCLLGDICGCVTTTGSCSGNLAKVCLGDLCVCVEAGTPTPSPTSPTTTSTSSPTTTSTSSPTTTSTSSPTTTASCPDGLVYTCLLGDICGCVTTSGSCPGNLVKLCVGDTCVCVEAGTPTPSPSFSQPTSTSTSTSTASSTSVPTCPGGVVYTCLLGDICGCVTTTGSCSGNLAKVCLGDLCVCVEAGTPTPSPTSPTTTSTSSPTTTSTSSPTTTSTSSPTTTSTSSPTTTASCPDGLVYTCLLGDICGCVTTSGSCPGNLVKLCVGDTCVCVEAGTPTPSPSFSQPTSTSTSTSTASSTSVPTCPGGVVYTCLLGDICGCVTTTGSCSGNLAKVCLGDLCVCVEAGTPTPSPTSPTTTSTSSPTTTSTSSPTTTASCPDGLVYTCLLGDICGCVTTSGSCPGNLVKLCVGDTCVCVEAGTPTPSPSFSQPTSTSTSTSTASSTSVPTCPGGVVYTCLLGGICGCVTTTGSCSGNLAKVCLGDLCVCVEAGTPTPSPTSPTTTSTSSPTTTSTSSPTTTSTSSPTTTASCPDGLVYTCLLGDICGCVTTSGSCPGNLVKLCVGDTCVCVEAGTPTPSPSFSQPTSTSTSTSTASSTSVPTCPGGVVYTCLLGGICGCVTTTGSCSGNLAKVCLGDLCVCVQAGTSTSNGTASSGVSEAFFAEPERNSTHSAESAPRATATVTPAVVHPTPSPYIAKMNAMSMTPSSSQASSLSVSTLPVATTATLPPPFTPVITTSTSGGSFLDNVEPGGERNSHSSTLGAVAPAMRTTISPPTFSSLGSTPRPGTGIDAPTTSSSGPDRIIEQTSAIPVSSSSSRAGNLGSGTSDTSSGSNSGTPGSGTSYTGSGSSSGTSGSGTSDNGSGSSSGTSGSGTSGSGGLSSTNNGMNMTAFGRWFYVVPRIQHVQNII